MTTAARPTYDPARGGTGRSESDLGALSKQYSSRDLPGHTKLKYRQDGQNSANDVKNRDFRRELEEKERINQEKKDRSRGSGSSGGGSNTKRARIEQLPASNIDADDPVDEDEDDDDDSDEDDTAALQAELEKIKRERATEAARKEAERKVMEEKIRMENILKGNPLLNQEKSDFKVKRRWDDDVVFKNCASGEDKRKDKGFINDSLRSEFHKKFMEKYIN